MIAIERGKWREGREGKGREGLFPIIIVAWKGQTVLKSIGVASLKFVALRLLDRKLERKGGRLPEVGWGAWFRYGCWPGVNCDFGVIGD